MKTFAINTLGCKVNQYESQQIRQTLEQFGLSQVPDLKQADLAVINTCCVTHIASAKCRQNIRKALRKAKGPVIVTGCLPLGQPEELENITGNIHIVRRKNDFPAAVASLLPTQYPSIQKQADSRNLLHSNIKPKKPPKIKQKNNLSTLTENINEENSIISNLPLLSHYKDQTRAFLKIQDGCDAFCSYCIIPQIRTRVCNKNVKSVLTEAQQLIKAGHKEIVLTGIFLGAYGQSTVRRKHWDQKKKDSLALLLEELAQLDGLQRLRLSSLEPADVTDKLLDVFCKHSNIMPHLHLPLQSGSQGILKKMVRQYSIDEYLKVIEKVKNRLDRPAVTTDIIVGFPGETEDDFAQTLTMAEDIAFSKIHVFSFSARKNTPAAKMPDQITPQVIKERSKRLQNLDKKMQLLFRKRFIGEKINVLFEAEKPLQGRCERYFMVKSADLQTQNTPKIGQIAHGILLR